MFSYLRGDLYLFRPLRNLKLIEPTKL